MLISDPSSWRDGQATKTCPGRSCRAVAIELARALPSKLSVLRSRWHASVFWLSFPFVLPQALWLRHRTNTLPGAPGPGLGQEGKPVTLRILGLGDSIIDGVGTPHRSRSLTAQIARHLADGASWHALGRSGYRTWQTASQLLPELGPEPYDLVVISTGVNDITGLVSMKSFAAGLSKIDNVLRRHSPEAHILLLGVPPMWHFPALPQPLRWAIGQRARAFQLAGQLAAERLGWRFLASDFVPEPEEFADDGYHPNADAVCRWAEDIAAFAARMGA